MSPYVARFIIFSQRLSSIVSSSGEYLMMEELLCRASVLFIMCVYDPTPTKAVVLEMCLPRSQVGVDAVHLERSYICILCMQQNYVLFCEWTSLFPHCDSDEIDQLDFSEDSVTEPTMITV